MKLSRSVFSLLALSLFVATCALANSTTKESLHLNENVLLAGHALKPGNYNVEWQGPGPRVNATILKGDTVVAQVPARLAKQSAKEEQSGYETQKKSDGTQVLTGILFSGKDYSLQFSPMHTNTQSASPGSM